MTSYFAENIKKKIPPKKAECEAFIKQNAGLFHGKTWVQVKTFIYNTYRNKH